MFGQRIPLSKNEEVELKDRDSVDVLKKVPLIPPDLRTKNNKRKSESHTPDLSHSDEKEASHQGEKDALKNIIREQEINQNMLDEALDRAQTVLFKCKTVFPLDFFPNDLIVDLAKVTVIKRSFFMSGGMQSVYMKDIVDVEVDTGPFFSSLSVVDMFYAPNKLNVKNLRKKDALRAREIILGVVAASKLNVNVTKLDGDELIQHIRELALANRAPIP